MQYDSCKKVSHIFVTPNPHPPHPHHHHHYHLHNHSMQFMIFTFMVAILWMTCNRLTHCHLNESESEQTVIWHYGTMLPK